MRKLKKLSSVSILIATTSLLFALTPPVTEQAKEIKEVDTTCEEVELAGLYTYEVDFREEEIKEQEYIMNMKQMSTKSKEKEKKDEDKIENRWDITLTKDETELLAKIVFLEANLEPLKGQEAVVEVIFNRMVSDYYGGDVEHVLSAKGQFSSWKNVDKATPTEDNYKAIKEVINGETAILKDKETGKYNKNYTQFSRGGHKAHKDMIQIGNHQFCTE